MFYYRSKNSSMNIQLFNNPKLQKTKTIHKTVQSMKRIKTLYWSYVQETGLETCLFALYVLAI